MTAMTEIFKMALRLNTITLKVLQSYLNPFVIRIALIFGPQHDQDAELKKNSLYLSCYQNVLSYLIGGAKWSFKRAFFICWANVLALDFIHPWPDITLGNTTLEFEVHINWIIVTEFETFTTDQFFACQVFETFFSSFARLVLSFTVIFVIGWKGDLLLISHK